jgi:heme/copper-type cytochrome/quinol oxidase subunit 2
MACTIGVAVWVFFRRWGEEMGREFARCLFHVSSAFALMLTAIVVCSEAAKAQEPTVQVIELTAKKYEFSSSPVRIKAGTKVQLKIKALDHDHGFKIAAIAEGAKSVAQPGLIFASSQDCLLLRKGETATVEFVAQTPGVYEFKCCHTCGFGHRGMKGQIVVE